MVPITVPGRVSPASVTPPATVSLSPGETSRTSPKSSSFTRPSRVMKTFSGFRSR